MILEAIPATLGFPPPEPGYLEAVANAAARERGALLLIDEVQDRPRANRDPWYSSRKGSSRDLLITGKGLGGGVYPVSAAL